METSSRFLLAFAALVAPTALSGSNSGLVLAGVVSAASSSGSSSNSSEVAIFSNGEPRRLGEWS